MRNEITADSSSLCTHCLVLDPHLDGLLAYSGRGLQVMAINRPNLTTATFLFHAMTRENYNSEWSEKAIQAIFFPYGGKKRKKKRKKKKKWGFMKFKHSLYYGAKPLKVVI